ncbi:hypothetical protein B0H11DRAFT_802666 [Mycena galericulata]|nr:hypothetical protein B0H11DRAFT_802666 [Mycena galericulata]
MWGGIEAGADKSQDLSHFVTDEALVPNQCRILSCLLPQRKKMEVIATRPAAKPATESDTPTQDSSQKRKLDSADSTPSSDPAPSSKRAKQGGKSAFQTFARHSRFWASDGNAILRFESVAFKVHRGRLSTQSVWFEKLFERQARRKEPLKVDEEDIKDVVVKVLDDCDVYYLEELGSELDFEALLTMMEDAIEFYYSAPPFLAVAAVFRAATTFKFPKFVEFARQYLLNTFSDRLEDVTPQPIANPVAAIILGRAWKLPGILKRGFYELLRAPPEASIPDLSDDEDGAPREVYLRRGLDVDDLIRILDTQKHLAAAWQSVLLSDVDHNCPSMTPCAPGRPTGGWTSLREYHCDPICGLNVLVSARSGFCDQCVTARNAWLVGKKSEIWDDLDSWLNIPANDEIETD